MTLERAIRFAQRRADEEDHRVCVWRCEHRGPVAVAYERAFYRVLSFGWRDPPKDSPKIRVISVCYIAVPGGASGPVKAHPAA